MILLTDKDIAKIERALGIIEGVSCDANLGEVTVLNKAIDVIEEVIKNER